MARTYTQAEVDDLLQAERRRTEERMEERFTAERVFLTRLIDMHAHKTVEYQKIVTTMSSDIINTNKRIGQADGEIIALMQVFGGLLFGMRHAPAAHPMSCGMQASRTMRPF
jgi:tRNA A-37 threonylcarbamoyl transferase component Bud32